MASTKTKFAVGLFVAGGVSIALLAIIWLGATRYFEKGQYYVTYFNESVQGLDKDSPVKYRGVAIGRVAKIGVAPDSKLIEVILNIDSGQRLGSEIVAQLKLVGITGSMFIELDQKKEDEPDRSPYLSFPSKYQIVASKPSDISELLQGINNVLEQLSTLDIEGVSGKIKLTLDSLNQAIADANLKAVSTNLASSLERIDRKVLVRVESTAARLERSLTATGQNLERASANLNRLLDLIADQPSQLLFSEPPSPRKVEPDDHKK